MLGQRPVRTNGRLSLAEGTTAATTHWSVNPTACPDWGATYSRFMITMTVQATEQFRRLVINSRISCNSADVTEDEAHVETLATLPCQIAFSMWSPSLRLGHRWSSTTDSRAASNISGPSASRRTRPLPIRIIRMGPVFLRADGAGAITGFRDCPLFPASGNPLPAASPDW